MGAFPAAAAALLMLALCGQMVTIEAEDKCQQPKEVGRCMGYFRKYFYNSETGTCEQFIYGGCGGNDNRFDTVEQCQAACAENNVCHLPKEPGMCMAFFPKFFYNTQTGTCEKFIYGGCGGNGNKFDTKEQCQAACANEDVCQLPKQPGLCKGYFPKFFYNTETGACEQFVYGGCGGNGNKFDTKEKCQAACA